MYFIAENVHFYIISNVEMIISNKITEHCRWRKSLLSLLLLGVELGFSYFQKGLKDDYKGKSSSLNGLLKNILKP